MIECKCGVKSDTIMHHTAHVNMMLDKAQRMSDWPRVAREHEVKRDA